MLSGQSKLEGAFDAVETPIILFDAKLGLQHLNPACLTLIDRPIESLTAEFHPGPPLSGTYWEGVVTLTADSYSCSFSAAGRWLDDASFLVLTLQPDSVLAEERLQAVWMSVEEGIFIIDQSGTYIDVNPHGCKMFGYTHDEIVGNHVHLLHFREDIEDALKTNQQEYWQRGGRIPEVRLRRKDGSVIWVSMSITPFQSDGQNYVLGIKHDITKRKSINEELAEQHRFLQTLLDSIPNPIVYKDHEGRYLEVNRAFEMFSGKSRNEVIGTKVTEQTDDPATVLHTAVDEVLLREGGSIQYEADLRYADGSSRHTVVYKAALQQDDNPRGLIATLIDVGELHQAKRELEESQQMLATLMSNLPGMVYRCLNDESRTMLFVSEGCLDLTGYHSDELLNNITSYADLIHPEDRQMVAAQVNRAVESGQPFQLSYRLNTKQGEQRWVWERGKQMVLSDGQRILEGFIADITARKQAERLLSERAAHLLLVNQIASKITAQVELKSLLQTTADLIHSWFGYHHVGIFMKDSDKLRMQARAGLYAENFPDDHTLDADVGIIGWVSQNMKPLLSNDVADEQHFHNPFDSDIIKAELALPLIIGDQLLGVLDVQSQERDAFSEEDLLALDTLSGQLASAVHTAQLYEAERTQRYLAEAQAQTAAIISDTLNLEQVLGRILAQLAGMIPHDGAYIVLYDKSHGKRWLVAAACRCYAANMLTPPTVGEVVDLPDETLKDDPRPLITRTENWRREAWVESTLCAPIHLNDRVAGWIVLESSSSEMFNQDHLAQLSMFVNHAGIAIQNAQLFRELEEYSSILVEAVEERTTELQRTKEHVEAILNNSPDAIILLSSEGLINSGNPAFSKLFDYHIDKLFKKPVLVLGDESSKDTCEALLQKAKTSQKPQRSSIIARRADGSAFDADVALAPIVRDDELIAFVCTIRDISELKQVERMKDQFVANVSHELRTPITGLKLNHRLLTMDPDQHAKYAQRMGREIDRLNILIEDLLRLSRLDQGRVDLKLEPVNLNKIGERYTEDRRPIASERNLTLSFYPLQDFPLIHADEGLVEQAVSVLLTNALNYTPFGGTVSVFTEIKDRWDGIGVRDTGPGVPIEEQAQLFERFHRGKIGRNSGVSGTGLGLSIAREIVAKHGGQIELISAEGEGATFVIWLPLNKESRNDGRQAHISHR